jgi:hypothetical protein
MTITAAPSELAAAWLAIVNAPGLSAQEVEWETTVRPAAAHKGTELRKVTTATVMVGAEYSNLAVNNDRETGDLPWGEWDVYPYIVTHRGNYYARLYTIDGTIRTTHYVNGERVTREAFQSYLTPSQRDTKRPNGGTITVKVENLRLA